MRKWIIGVVVVAVIAVLAIPRLLAGSSTANGQTSQTGTVERMTLNTTIESTGTVMPAQSLSLNFGAAGSVTEISVDVGDTVEAGQVLARLDTTDLEYQVALTEQSLAQAQANYDNLIAPPTDQELAQAQANLASAQSQLANALVSQETAADQITTSCANVDSASSALDDAQQAYEDYVNAGYTYDANFIPDPDSQAGTALRSAQNSFEVAQAQCDSASASADKSAQIASAQAAVAQAQTALDTLIAGPTQEQIAAQTAQLNQAQLQHENAQRALQDAQIIAPFAGVITNVPIVVGQNVTAQTSAITLIDNSTLYVDISVDELDIAQVALGQPATISIDAIEGTTLDGTVIRIAPAGSLEQGVVTYDVRISLTPTEEVTVRPGMTADAAVIVGTIEDALVVPTQAIQRDGNQEYVMIMNASGQSTRVNVTSGQTTDGLTIVTGDLEEGQTIDLNVSSTVLPRGPGGNFGG
ncbi:MAG: efflux RND transporter periplasmic adaptor subunit [Anaerolineae bacterium]